MIKNFRYFFRFAFAFVFLFTVLFSNSVGVLYAVCVNGNGDYVEPVNGACPSGSFDPSTGSPDSQKSTSGVPNSNSNTYTSTFTTYSGGNGSNVTQNNTTYSAPKDSGGVLTNISGVLARLGNLMNLIIPFLVGLAVFIIIYGILGYISFSADEEKRKQARDFIAWGVIGVFLMLSVWGLVTILLNTFNLNNSNAIVTQTYPAFNNGQPTTDPTTVLELIDRMNSIGSRIIPFLIGIAVFIIILGIVGYVRDGSNEEKRAEGRMFVLWGVISVFLMLSIWGLVNILVNSFNLNNSLPKMPSLPKIETINTPK
jgi:uncharacterized membrane protein YidH (DUF202 family)